MDELADATPAGDAQVEKVLSAVPRMDRGREASIHDLA